ncbi:MAG TPA: hypothetical protein PKA64_02575, partial [Myxococcota bacterium]|nr:hypothetical protein [Myxococcota bacterium]
GEGRVAWSGGPAGWTPPAPLARGSYAAEAGPSGVVLVGVCDVDGDGVPARYTATPDGPILRQTPPDVY